MSVVLDLLYVACTGRATTDTQLLFPALKNFGIWFCSGHVHMPVLVIRPVLLHTLLLVGLHKRVSKPCAFAESTLGPHGWFFMAAVVVIDGFARVSACFLCVCVSSDTVLCPEQHGYETCEP